MTKKPVFQFGGMTGHLPTDRNIFPIKIHEKWIEELYKMKIDYTEPKKSIKDREFIPGNIYRQINRDKYGYGHIYICIKVPKTDTIYLINIANGASYIFPETSVLASTMEDITSKAKLVNCENEE